MFQRFHPTAGVLFPALDQRVPPQVDSAAWSQGLWRRGEHFVLMFYYFFLFFSQRRAVTFFSFSWAMTEADRCSAAEMLSPVSVFDDMTENK